MHPNCVRFISLTSTIDVKTAFSNTDDGADNLFDKLELSALQACQLRSVLYDFVPLVLIFYCAKIDR